MIVTILVLVNVSHTSVTKIINNIVVL